MNTAPNTPADLIEAMLRDAVQGDQLSQHHINDRHQFDAHVHATVNAYVAAMAIDALRIQAPEYADGFAQAVADRLDAGDIGGYSYRAAKGAGHDPEQWITDVQARITKGGAAR